MNSSDHWIFGYGSLIWRVGFPHLESRPAFIRHWARRFWQGSTDHRGVPEAPGRVVTLISEPKAQCWGRAYRLDPETRDEVLAHLDHREKGGYERLRLPLFFDETHSIEGITYHATSTNPNYLGPAGLDVMAAQIVSAHGPSGANIEYVLHLDRALEEMGVIDPHVRAVAGRVNAATGKPCQ